MASMNNRFLGCGILFFAVCRRRGVLSLFMKWGILWYLYGFVYSDWLKRESVCTKLSTWANFFKKKLLKFCGLINLH